jgi:hypothetical protein
MLEGYECAIILKLSAIGKYSVLSERHHAGYATKVTV